MIYFDNAATTLQKPESVPRAVLEAMTSFGNPGRGVHEPAMAASRAIYDARCALARLFHAENPARIAFTANATQALNIAIKGILSPGDHVITTVMEHNSVLRPLYELAERGVELTILPADKQGRVEYEVFEAAIQSNTRAIVCTHGSNLTGNLVDMGKIGAIAKAHGLLLVADASQTAGVFPIDAQDMNIDILCFTGHKGLLGPQGTGGLYVREGVTVRPLLTGGSGVQSHSKVHPIQMPTALEAGTLNAHGLAGLNAGVGYLLETGIDRIRQKELDLMWAFYEGVKEVPGITVYGDFSGRERCPIVSLNVRDYDSAQVSDALFSEFGIATRPGAHCAPLMHEALGTGSRGAVRFSFSHFSTMEEIKYAVSALREIAREE